MNCSSLCIKTGSDYWVGATVWEGARDFSKVQVFFHPKPTNGGALDKDYPQLISQGWRAKYDHMWYLGAQLTVVRDTALIYPFMRESAFSKGSPTFMFATRPKETLSAIVSAVRKAVTGKSGAVDVVQIGASGFSSGVEGMKNFAAAFGSSIVETTDFFGDRALEDCLVRDRAHVTTGAVCEHVTKIHSALVLLDNSTIDNAELQEGRYGPSTAAAVLAYKRKRRIINYSYETTADDIVGKMTIAAMDRELLPLEILSVSTAS